MKIKLKSNKNLINNQMPKPIINNMFLTFTPSLQEMTTAEEERTSRGCEGGNNKKKRRQQQQQSRAGGRRAATSPCLIIDCGAIPHVDSMGISIFILSPSFYDILKRFLCCGSSKIDIKEAKSLKIKYNRDLIFYDFRNLLFRFIF